MSTVYEPNTKINEENRNNTDKILGHVSGYVFRERGVTVIIGTSVLLLFPKAQTKSPPQFRITSHLVSTMMISGACVTPSCSDNGISTPRPNEFYWGACSSRVVSGMGH